MVGIAAEVVARVVWFTRPHIQMPMVQAFLLPLALVASALRVPPLRMMPPMAGIVITVPCTLTAAVMALPTRQPGWPAVPAVGLVGQVQMAAQPTRITAMAAPVMAIQAVVPANPIGVPVAVEPVPWGLLVSPVGLVA